MNVSDLEKELDIYTSSLIFDEVFNEPSRPNNDTFILRNLTKTSVRNKLVRREFVILMPTQNTNYFVYALDEVVAESMNLKENVWVSLFDIQGATATQFHLFSNIGTRVPNKFIYAMRTTMDNKILVAVLPEKIFKVNDTDPNYDHLYLQVYRDPTISYNYSVSHTTVTSSTNSTALGTIIDSASRVFINGLLINSPSVSTIVINDEVECVFESPYLAKFIVDIASGSTRINYISSLDNLSRTVVHTPKLLNPNNNIISSKYCDIYVYPRNTNSGSSQGTKLFSASSIFCNRQLTHNDFAIPDVMINAQMNMHKVDEVIIEICVKYISDNTLINEALDIKQLYTKSDEEILKQFENKSVNQNINWTAINLDKGAYASLIDDGADYDLSINDVNRVKEALGIFNYSALVENRISTKTVQFKKQVNITIPPSLIKRRVSAIVYKDGAHLDRSNYRVGRDIDGTLLISFLNDIVNTGDRITSILQDDREELTLYIKPSSTNNKVERYTDAFKLYEKLNVSTTQYLDFTNTFGYLDKTNELSDLIDITKSSSTAWIRFKPSSYGREFIIVYPGGTSVNTFNLDDMINNDEPIAVSIRNEVNVVNAGIQNITDGTNGGSFSSSDIATRGPVNGIDYNHSRLDAIFTYDSSVDSWRNRFIVTSADNDPFYINYTLPLDQLDTKTLVAYKIGFLTKPTNCNGMSYRDSSIDSVPELPILIDTTSKAKLQPALGDYATQVTSWDIYVDDVKVHSVTDYRWTGDLEAKRSFVLPTPILINSTVSIAIKDSSGEEIISLSGVEFLCSTSSIPKEVPYLGYKELYVYLNNRYLIEGLDYKLKEVTSSGIVVDTLVVVYNKEYLTEDSNVLTIYKTRDIVLDKSQDFSKGHIGLGKEGFVSSLGSLSTYKDMFFYTQGITTLHVNGYIKEVLQNGRDILPLNNQEINYPYELATRFTRELGLSTRDLGQVNKINVIMENITHMELTVDPIPPLNEEGYKIYSPVIVSILKAVDNGLILPFDPDLRRVIASINRFKDVLKDEVIKTTKLDKKYLKFEPTIKVVVDTPLLQQLIKGVTSN